MTLDTIQFSLRKLLYSKHTKVQYKWLNGYEAKLAFNVTGLCQVPSLTVTSYETSFYSFVFSQWIIFVQYVCSASPFPDLLASCLNSSGHAYSAQVFPGRSPASKSPAVSQCVRFRNRPVYVVGKLLLICPFWNGETVLWDSFTCPRLFHAWVTTLSYTPLLQTVPGWDANVFSVSTISWIYVLWDLIVIREKSYVPVNCVLNLHNGRDLTSGQQILILAFSNLATLYTLAGGKATQLMVVWSICVSPSAVLKVPVRSTTSLVLCADISFPVYFSIQTVLPRRMVIRTMTSFSRKLTFTLSNDPLLGFFQLS